MSDTWVTAGLNLRVRIRFDLSSLNALTEENPFDLVHVHTTLEKHQDVICCRSIIKSLNRMQVMFPCLQPFFFPTCKQFTTSKHSNVLIPSYCAGGPINQRMAHR